MSIGRILCLALALPSLAGACSGPDSAARTGAPVRARPDAAVAAPVEPAAVEPAADPSRSDRPPDLPTDLPTDLIDIASIDPTIAVEVRYATTRNFTKVKLYPVARCLLRRDAAERLARVQKELAAHGVGLKVWDCYRPFSVQRHLWKLVPDSRYVAEPVAAADGTPIKGSKHNRGAAVDLTLVRAGGGAVEMPTDHDDFSARAHRGDPKASAEARRNSELLERAMSAQGFAPLPTEWWHFDAPGWERYPLSDEPLTR
jgi:zinc D-Ala-D-Ala dipeptidase